MRFRLFIALGCCWGALAAPRILAKHTVALPQEAVSTDAISDAALAYGANASLDPLNRVSAFDRRFLQQAGVAGHAELVYAKLALHNGERADVRAFAQKMINDHITANSELRILAEGKNVVLSTDLDAAHQATHQELAALHGEAFDTAYIEHQVRAHITSTNMLRQAAAQSTDAQIKNWAEHRLPIIASQLQMARDLADGRKPVS